MLSYYDSDHNNYAKDSQIKLLKHNQNSWLYRELLYLSELLELKTVLKT